MDGEHVHEHAKVSFTIDIYNVFYMKEADNTLRAFGGLCNFASMDYISR